MSTCLVGKTVTGVKIAADREALLFETTDGNIVCKVDGDCCSHTWIEEVETPALGFPAKVISMDSLEMPQTAAKTKTEYYEDEMQYYGYKIVTDRGEIVIAYRNSSNGYYGGSLHWPDDGYYYGGVGGQNISKEEWQELTP